MPRFDEASFREALDSRGLLRDGALPWPTRDAFVVFAQRSDARMDIEVWQQHAERFFDTRLGLTTGKRYDDPAPRRDAARVVVSPLRGAGGTRTVWGRPREDDDLVAAERAQGGAGLALLAKRCAQVWLVEIDVPDDAVALRLAAILAGVCSGPILAPGGGALFGPRTARQKLEG